MASHDSPETPAVRPRRSGWMLPLILFAVVAAAGAWWLAERDRPQETVDGRSSAQLSTSPSDGAVGTAGHDEPRGEDAAAAAPSVIREIETITGTVDGHELIGRRVDLRVPVQSKANDVAFWIGMGDNRILVVMARDTRDDRPGDDKRLSTHGIWPVRSGQQALIAGTIQRLPNREQMFSWELTEADRRELEDRRIYIRADRVTANGHGG